MGNHYCRDCQTSDSGTCDACAEFERQRWLCTRCHEAEGDSRYSLGIYAGRYCDACWEASGYRKEGREGFDPLDAGEAYDESDY